MKIALLHYSSPPVVGGVENVLGQHAHLMVRAGHEVMILAGRGQTFDERIKVHIRPTLNSRHPEVLKIKNRLDQGNCPPAFDRLSAQIREELLAELKGFDLLIAHNIASMHKNLPLTAALHEVYQTPRFPRLVLWHHDLAWSAPRYRGELHAGFPWDLVHSDWDKVTHVTVSDLRRQELAGMLDIAQESIRVIPNGVDLSSFSRFEAQTIQLVEQLELMPADPLMLLPARLTPRKNIELALRVLVELRKEYPRATLLVTGPEGAHNPTNANYKRKLLQLRDQLKLQRVVHFLAEVSPGNIPDAVIADFYRLADALIYPSREEGFGIPMLEAAVSSLPVFCADIPVLRELGRGDVSYFDTEAAPSAIACQIHDRLEGEATSRWARRAKHGFSWDFIYAAYIEPLIQEVMT